MRAALPLATTPTDDATKRIAPASDAQAAVLRNSSANQEWLLAKQARHRESGLTCACAVIALGSASTQRFIPALRASMHVVLHTAGDVMRGGMSQ